MNCRQIADRLVALCRAGRFVDAIEELYAEDVRQSENASPPMAGKAGLVDACRGWIDSRVIHGTEILGTHVAEESFVLEMRYDVTPHATRERHQWAEAAVYRVANGKIVDVGFYYKPAPA